MVAHVFVRKASISIADDSVTPCDEIISARDIVSTKTTNTM